VFALLQQGKADLVLGYVNTIGFREGQIGMLPGLVNSREQSLRFADTTLAQLLASRLEAQVRARKLFWLWEKSVIASRGRPVRLPEDARNLGAVRAVGPYIDLFREIGAATTAVALSEVWTTMQRGLVSAAVVPAWMLAGAPATAADAVVVPDGDVGFYSLIAVAISPKSFDRLPPDLQRVLVESAAQAERAAPALLAQEDQLAAGAFASQGKSVVALDWRRFDAWIRLAREKTWIPVIGRMQTDERMIEALRQFVIGRSEKAA
jgi:TRAP-type C4-dicarboxylate transport system substrate-binding protein